MTVDSPLDKILEKNPDEAKKIASEKVNLIRKEFQKHGILNKPNTLYSLFFLFRDICICTFGYYIFFKNYNFLNETLGYIFSLILSSVVLGTLLISLWVIGHECGHGAFSKSIGNIVGFIVHSALLVPYYSWQYTHSKHHKYTNSLIKGETHVPAIKRKTKMLKKVHDFIGEDAFAIIEVVLHLILGWPLYLIRNETGGRVTSDMETKLNKKKFNSHFFPGQLFPNRWDSRIYKSTFGIMCTLSVLFYLNSRGYDTLYFYWGPYIVVNSWLVAYTWLHHTNENVPHYGNDVFTYEIGALSTIDRSYNYWINHLHHNIGSTHVAHHIFSQIPHYRAVKATKIIKEVLGDYYRFDDTNVFKALFLVGKNCHFVDNLDGVQYVKSF